MSLQPVLVVGAIVMDGGRLLLVKRSREPEAGRWTFPGGRVETGETMREALVREVQEECGLDIEVDAPIGVVEKIIRNDDGRVGFHYVIVDFLATARSTEILAGDDAADARWVPTGELSTLPLTDGLLEFLADRGVLEGRRPRV